MLTSWTRDPSTPSSTLNSDDEAIAPCQDSRHNEYLLAPTSRRRRITATAADWRHARRLCACPPCYRRRRTPHRIARARARARGLRSARRSRAAAAAFVSTGCPSRPSPRSRGRMGQRRREIMVVRSDPLAQRLVLGADR